MNEKKIYPICVIGGGAAGLMAVLRSVLNNDLTLFFPGDKRNRRKSRGFWVSKVENIPGFSQYKKGITEPNKETLKWIKQSDFANKLEHLVNRGVVSLNKNKEGLFEITDNQGEIYFSRYVILCTGLMDVQPKINDSIDLILPYANVQLADYCLRCDGHHVLNKNTSIICDGEDGGAWVAIMLMERYDCPSMILLTNGRENKISEKVKKILDKYKVQINTQRIIDIDGDSKNHLLKSFVMEGNQKIQSDICFVSLGMILYNDLAKNLGAKLDDRGFVTTDEKGHSSIKNLFVAGDLRAGIKKQIYTSWDSAVDSADQINSFIRQEKRSTNN